MRLIIEAEGPFKLRPGFYRSRVMSRAWWGWLVVSMLHVPLYEFAETSYDWRMPDGQVPR